MQPAAIICNMSLRAGEQTAGAAFVIEEECAIARAAGSRRARKGSGHFGAGRSGPGLPVVTLEPGRLIEPSCAHATPAECAPPAAGPLYFRLEATMPEGRPS
ncbi:hypothetical protein [Methylibium sp.]|uniref:hypothetical protein n=1 Tax=Methylibium sp. TaxID=2067992 RepID=UPI003D0F2C4C